MPPSRFRIVAREVALFVLLSTVVTATAFFPLYRLGLVQIRTFILSTASYAMLLSGVLMVSRSFHRRATVAIYALSAFVAVLVFAAGGLVVRLYPQLDSHMISTFLYVTADSNPAEAIEYVRGYASMADLVSLLLVPLLVALVLLATSRELIDRQLQILVGLLMILLAIGGTADSKSLAAPLAPFRAAYERHRDEMVQMEQLAAHLAPANLEISRTRNGARNETFVLVIGESTSRHHMQLYGYSRDTTPRLSTIKDDLFVFSDVVAPDCHTIPVLKKALTPANFLKPDEWTRGEDLIAVFKRAGFQTWWISNQGVLGEWDTWTTAFAERADHSIFTNLTRFGSASRYDDAVLAPFQRALSSSAPKKFIVVHLLGTHLAAKYRYPQSWNVYQKTPLPEDYQVRASGDRSAIDEYDNAVRYHDSIIAQLLERVRSQGTSSRFVYFADHGEEVMRIDDYVGHNAVRPTSFMYEVPMLVWTTPDAEMRVPKNVIEGRPFQTDDLFHSVLDLAGIRTQAFVEERSVFSERFVPKRRFVNYIDYDFWRSTGEDGVIAARPCLATRPRFPKIWVHRANSGEKIAALRPRYDGFEVDLVFDTEKNEFDVNHPPAPSIGLTLEELWSGMRFIDGAYFWLDIKNLSDENASAVLAYLNGLASRFKLKERLIVESPRADLLVPFTNSGFYTSYYLPDVKDFRSEEEWLAHIAWHAPRCGVRALSTTHQQYSRLRNRFREYDVLVWNPIDLEEISEDLRVIVILQKVRTPHDR